MSDREKVAKNQMSHNDAVAVAERTVTISEMEYNSLKAAAELISHPDVLLRTLAAIGKPRAESLEEAFEEDEKSDKARANQRGTQGVGPRTKRGGLKSA